MRCSLGILGCLQITLMTLPISCASSGSTTNGAVNEIPGYVHTFARSRFILGDFVTQLDRSGLHEIVGTIGIFNTLLASGAADAVPNHSIPEATARYYPDGAGEQDIEVRSYFESAGMPGDQVTLGAAEPVAGVQIPVSADGGLEYADASSSSAWFSNLHRVFDGVEIMDSFAWAILDDSGASVEESVYWPSIGADVVNQLRAFQSMLGDSRRRATFLAALPTAATDGHLVIHHTKWTWSGPFLAQPCFEAKVASAAFCFSSNADPVLMPDE